MSIYLQFLSALSRVIRPLLMATFLLGSILGVQAQDFVYGIGTLSRTILASEGNPFLPPNTTFFAGDQGIFRISTATGTFGSPGSLATPITGYTTPTTALPRQSIIGSDYRPNDGLLYALGYTPPVAATLPGSAQLYTLEPITGVLTPVGAAQSLLLGTDITRIGFDFNPVADLIRVVSSTGKNYRLSPGKRNGSWRRYRCSLCRYRHPRGPDAWHWDGSVHQFIYWHHLHAAVRY